MSAEIIRAGIALQKALVAAGRIPAVENFEAVPFAYFIHLDKEGRGTVINKRPEISPGAKKEKVVFQRYSAPRIQRSSGIHPNFLCDNGTYMFGLPKSTERKDVVRAPELHAAFVRNITMIIDRMEVDGKDASKVKLIRTFYERHVDALKASPGWQIVVDNAIREGTFVIGHDLESPIVEDPEIQPYLNFELYEDTSKRPIIQCCVTGQWGRQGGNHGTLKVPYGETTGGKLSSVNFAAFESWGMTGAENAPMISEATRGYHRGLNYIMNNNNFAYKTEDVTWVAWDVETGESSPLVSTLLQSGGEGDAPEAVRRFRSNLVHAFLSRDHPVKPIEGRLVVLALSKGYRVVPRYFREGDASEFTERAAFWFASMLQDRPSFLERTSAEITIPQFMDALQGKLPNGRTTVKSDSFRAVMIDRLLTAAMTGTPIPRDTLGYAVDAFVTSALSVASSPRGVKQDGGAGVSGSYLAEVYRHRCIALMRLIFNWNKVGRDIPVALDIENKEVPYLLGRLFAMFEKAQQASVKNYDLNMNGRLRLFMRSPGVLFPELTAKNRHHMRDSSTIWLRPHFNEVQAQLRDIPMHLSLEEQCLLLAGFRHQQIHFDLTRPKKDKGEENAETTSRAA